MATKERPIDRGTRKARALCGTFGEEIRRARVEHGLSQSAVAAAVELSSVHVGRIERGLVLSLSLYHACRLASVVGLDLSVKAYPSGDPIRDTAQLALLDRVQKTLSAAGSWHREVPLPLPNDQRAWDAVLDLPAGRVGFEAETHLADLQALQRKLSLKHRDDPSIGVVVLLVADTRSNRSVLRDEGQALRLDYPLAREAIALAVGSGRVPAANGIISL